MTDAPTPLLRLITRLNIGGPARQALLLTKGLRPEFDTILGCGTPTSSEGELTDPGVELHRLPLVRPPSPTDDPRALLEIRRILRTHRPALVHTHMAKAGTLGRIAAITSRNRPKLVHTFHGHVLDGYFRPAVQRAYVGVERVLARRTDILVAVSDEVRDDLLALGIGRPEQYRVIPLGLDLGAHFDVTGRSGVLRERLSLPDDAVLVGIVGRLVPIKDHETILRAMARLPDVHLAVVGDGELRAAVEGRVAELGLGDRVHLTGWMTDMPAVLADLDVVALSSRNEGTPVSLIEAAACGRPAVSTDVGGVRSVVEHERTGLLVPAGDDEALAAAIDRLAADAGLRARMGAAGRVAAERYRDDRLVRDITALYRDVLG